MKRACIAFFSWFLFTFAATGKLNDMATYTISVNERTNSGKALVAYLRQLGVLVDKVLVPRKKADPTRMTRKEFFERIEKAEEEYRNGQFTTQKPNESVLDMLKRSGYDV